MILAHLPVVVTFVHVVEAEKQKETLTMKQHLLTLIAKCLLNVPTYKWVSLIAGLEYGMEQWNGKWNGTMNVQSCS